MKRAWLQEAELLLDEMEWECAVQLLSGHGIRAELLRSKAPEMRAVLVPGPQAGPAFQLHFCEIALCVDVGKAAGRQSKN